MRMGVEVIEEGCGEMEGAHSVENDMNKVGLGWKGHAHSMCVNLIFPTFVY